MASSYSPPSKASSKRGAGFVKSKGGSAVKPTSAAGVRVGGTRCAAKRSNFKTGTGGSGY